ncbi:hypothetical protein Cme02nite_22790 [Catellatospora methionotrophica]|uniref:DNRLRE domain-containing protein n=1 Tax=Catellatospora methionotrophica TaxID=121620 RepID=A0A8J3L3M4_9ACTN|nr:hypothetical protein [Catellatospora methionotrophica]GIG13947.1 hypothetical protein Cme02nite_22790 [Catellatospora methionotrophica]
MLATGLVSVTAAPASAQETRSLTHTAWAYTDSRAPGQAFFNQAGPAPVGAWTGPDGLKHRSRSYFTFDISHLRGTVVSRALVSIEEATRQNCETPHYVELWRVDAISAATTWDNAPRRRELLGVAQVGGESGCAGWLGWDAMAAVQKLAQRDEQSITVEMRVPQGQEADLQHGRSLKVNAYLVADSNHVPTVVKVGLEKPDWACGREDKPVPVTGGTVRMMADTADVDSIDYARPAQFAAWPVGHEEQRVERSGAVFFPRTSKITWNTAGYQDGAVVAWQARAFDGYDYSAWSKRCYMKLDKTAPVAPTVTSQMYPDDGQPHGGQGVPGTFVFSANGSADVVGFHWRQFLGPVRYLAAPAPGSDATLKWTPQYGESFYVTSVDAAGNQSPQTVYTFKVNSTAPTANVVMGGVGLPSRLTVGTNIDTVTKFGYKVGDAAEVRVPANADHTAQVDFAFQQLGLTTVRVRSFAGSQLVGAITLDVDVSDKPVVTASDPFGVLDRQSTFALRPGRSDVVQYEYSIGSGPFTSLQAAADGSATLAWTPTEVGQQTLSFRSVSGNGTISTTTTQLFQVVDAKPFIQSGSYPQNEEAGAIGMPGTFYLGSSVPGAVSVIYQFNDEPEVTIPASVYGAAVEWAPSFPGVNALTARALLADGTFSPTATYTFRVSDRPSVSSEDYPQDGGVAHGQPGQPGRFTFRPAKTGVVEYRYSFYPSDTYITVPAGPDGVATPDIAPTHTGYNLMVVTAVYADGATSASREYSFRVIDPFIEVTSTYSMYSAAGGLGWVAEFTLRSERTDIATYEVRLNGDPVVTVPSTGFYTRTQLTMNRNGENVLSVRGRTASGEYTPQTDYPFLVGTAPLVTSSTYPAEGYSGGVGVTGEFTFTEGVAGVVEYEYQWEWYGVPTTTPAVAGAATFTFTPTSAGYRSLWVRGRLADGTWTAYTTHNFTVSYG